MPIHSWRAAALVLKARAGIMAYAPIDSGSEQLPELRSVFHPVLRTGLGDHPLVRHSRFYRERLHRTGLASA